MIRIKLKMDVCDRESKLLQTIIVDADEMDTIQTIVARHADSYHIRSFAISKLSDTKRPTIVDSSPMTSGEASAPIKMLGITSDHHLIVWGGCAPLTPCCGRERD